MTHIVNNRGPVKNLGPDVVIFAKQSEVRLRDQQYRIDSDSEDDDICEEVQTFEIDEAGCLQFGAQRICATRTARRMLRR